MRQQLAPFGGSLARMCRQAAQVRVSEAMVSAGDAIDGIAPLTEAIRMMVLHHVQSLLVTSGGSVTGILRLSDLFEEVADVIRATGGE
jgi:predicted transcriptional regulator